MAAPNGKYFIQDQFHQTSTHHESFLKLWQTKWKPLAERGEYPFLFGVARDFEPVVDEMVRLDMKEPFKWDVYAGAFNPKAEKLFNVAAAAEAAGELEKASEYYLRSSAVSFLARYPLVRCDAQRLAWAKGKEACLKGLQLRGTPVHEALIPHTYAIKGEGQVVPAFVSLPDGASKENPAPVVVGICGLDSWRTEFMVFAEVFRRNGIGLIAVEIPGTGDSPALAEDPLSPDRQWSSVLDWIDADERIDNRKLFAWGISTGGYYAIRIAHTHSTRFLGAICHGGACHHMFDREWLSGVDQREYAFSASESFAHKWGFGDDFDKCKNEASEKFSLLRDGTLDKPNCARLLLVNGMDDGVFPIDDFYVCLQHGSPKEMRVFLGEKHMGGRQATVTIFEWIFRALEIQVDAKKELAAAAFRAKH